ncbi:MAG TPA: hypothetical protein PLI21_06940, partial [Methanomassiliicoccaceae archaeon]|nr:hypothetical protein [Methanomassiliicoccaceae archaeon]
ASWMAQIMAATPTDPFAVLPKKFIQDRLGVKESEADEDDEPLSDDMVIGPASMDEYLRRTNDAHEAACKAAKARGDKLGPACGGVGAAPSRSKKDPPAKKKKSSARKQPDQAADPLPKNVRDKILTLCNQREKIGHPKHNYYLGKLGESLAKDALGGYRPHMRWTDAQDLSNGYLIDVKTLSPISAGTPIFSNQMRRKLELTNETGKKWKFVLLHVKDDRIMVYINTPPAEIYSGGPVHYYASIENSELIGYYDLDGNWHGSDEK